MLAAALVLAAIGLMSGESAQAEHISGIERRNSTNAVPVVAEEPLNENALAFVDRAYKYVEVPAEIAGAQYVQMANDDKRVANVELDVTLGRDAVVLLFVDNRVGNGGLAEHPADYEGVTPDLSSDMAWAAAQACTTRPSRARSMRGRPAAGPSVAAFAKDWSGGAACPCAPTCVHSSARDVKSARAMTTAHCQS